MPNIAPVSWYVLVRAEKYYLLLGGVPLTTSSRFETWTMANDWADVTVRTNLEAKRKIHSVQITASKLDPEILVDDMPGAI